MRQHRRDAAGDVGREAAPRGAAVERRAGGDEVGDVGDVDVRALAVDRERVVEVLRRLGIDRQRRQLAQVDASVERRLGRRVRLELLARALLAEQALEHVLDVLRGAEHALDARAPAQAPRDDEVAGVDVAEPLAVEQERRVRREVRLADDELAAARDLDDDEIVGDQRRKSCSPACNASSCGVAGSLTAYMSGVTPRSEMSWPPGVT